MIVDGERLAQEKEKELFALINQSEAPLNLGIVVFKGDPAGEKYSKLKSLAGDRLGIGVKIELMDFQDRVIIEKRVKELSDNPKTTGVMVQYPGKAWAEKQGMKRADFGEWWERLINLIDREKDVDGLREDSPFELGVVKAVMEIIERYKTKSMKVCGVVGIRGFVGIALIDALKVEGFEVKGLGRDSDLEVEGQKLDVLISVTGRPNLITERMVKKGAMVIDVGWPEGDVEFETVKDKASVITPVPGGVGPLSVVSLLENLVKGSYTTP